MDQNLESLRDRIREIDLELVKLAAERVQLARVVGETKRTQKKPVVDYAQERIVLERARRAATARSLDPSVAEDIMAGLIRASVGAQEEDSLRLSGAGTGKVAVVIGGAGRMGRWLSRFLETQGYTAGALDPRATADENEWGRERLPAADLVVGSAPPSTLAECYRDWAGAPPSGVIVDIASIKTPLIEPIRNLRKAGARVASIHPMFGPSITMLRDADVVVCETGDEEATREVEALFLPTTVRLVRIPLEEHDRLMADLLSLAHATAIAFALSLPEGEEPVRSTTFLALEKLAGEVVRESPDVYYEILSGNPHALSSVEKLQTALRRIQETVRNGNVGDFSRIHDEGQRRTRH